MHFVLSLKVWKGKTLNNFKVSLPFKKTINKGVSPTYSIYNIEFYY